MNEEDKLLLAKINDLFYKCDKYSSPVFSDFLDPQSQASINDTISTIFGYNILMFGGYDDSERKILGIFPEWQEVSTDEFPISVFKISHTFGDELSHRDYLGAVLGLGIDRSKIGDIAIDGKTAYLFCSDSICEYIYQNLSKIGNKGINLEKCEFYDICVPEKKFCTLNCVAASLRLDAVVAASLRVSRNIAAKMIENEKVSVNHKQISQTSKILSVGDLISVRGFGRLLLCESGAKTRNGRLHITLKKYI